MLTKAIIQKSVAVVAVDDKKIAEVLWVERISETDDVSGEVSVVSERNHRCAYSNADKDRFLSEVSEAESYIAVLGW